MITSFYNLNRFYTLVLNNSLEFQIIFSYSVQIFYHALLSKNKVFQSEALSKMPPSTALMDGFGLDM